MLRCLTACLPAPPAPDDYEAFADRPEWEARTIAAERRIDELTRELQSAVRLAEEAVRAAQTEAARQIEAVHEDAAKRIADAELGAATRIAAAEQRAATRSASPAAPVAAAVASPSASLVEAGVCARAKGKRPTKAGA